MTTRRSFLKVAIGSGVPPLAAAGERRERVLAWSMPKGRVLLSIWNPDGSETLGVKAPLPDDDPEAPASASRVLDVRRASALLGIAAPQTLDQLLHDGNLDGLERLIVAARARRAAPAIVPESSIKPGRLFATPEKIVCVGLNYRRHALEVGAPIPKVPVLFSKYRNALAPHQHLLRLPSRDTAYKFDYETELLVVIGRPARDVAESDALDYVAGYCCANDFSARDLQLETGGQWMIGKTLDGFAPIGPYFVSADLVGDPNRLKLETRVNGEVRQSSTTDDFIFDVAQLIAYISRHWTLVPGDLIFTGTPSGVIAGYPKERQVWLKAGDEIESSVEKLGTLRFQLG